MNDNSKKSWSSLVITRRGLVSGLGIAAVSSALSACMPNTLFHYICFRFTMEHNVEGALSRAETVIRKLWVKQPSQGLDSIGPYATWVWAEAPALWSKNIEYIFALLIPPLNVKGFDARLVERALVPFLPTHLDRVGSINDGQILSAIAMLEGRYPLPANSLPALVTFRDRNSPASIQMISEEVSISDMSGGFLYKQVSPSPDFKFFLEVTHSRSSETIRDLLPWLNSLHGRLSSATPQVNAPLAERVTTASFLLRGA